MKYFKKLVGDRIYLSPRNEEDAEIFTQWLNDFDTTDYIGRSSTVVTLSGEKEYLQKPMAENARNFAIINLENDKMIGTVGLENIDFINRCAILGIFIGDKDFRNNGYGAEAIRLLLDYGFNYLNLESVKLDLLAFNERALACYKKCGFQETGRRRKHRYINGEYYDVIIMDILKEEFNGEYIKNKNIGKKQ